MAFGKEQGIDVPQIINPKCKRRKRSGRRTAFFFVFPKTISTSGLLKSMAIQEQGHPEACFQLQGGEQGQEASRG